MRIGSNAVPLRQAQGDGNLPSMPPMTDEARAALARAWLDSSETQEKFAARHGIAERTLRAYVHRHAGRQEQRQALAPAVVDADIIQKLVGDVEQLQQRIDELQAEVKGLHVSLAAPLPDDAEREPKKRRGPEPDVDPLGPSGVADKTNAVAKPEVDDPGVPLGPDEPPSAGQEPQRRKHRTLTEMILEETDEAGLVVGDSGDEEHRGEPERHGAAKQVAVAEGPEPPQPEVEPVLPIAMPAADKFSWC